jgi:hypothetical protein
MLVHQAPTDDSSQQWRSSRGELVIERPTPRVVLFIERGFLDAEFADKITEAMDASLSAPGKPYFFVDCEFMDGYDPVVRSKATQWISRHRDRIVVQHMLVKSVASLMLGGVIAGHFERKTFEQELQRCIADTKRALS